MGLDDYNKLTSGLLEIDSLNKRISKEMSSIKSSDSRIKSILLKKKTSEERLAERMKYKNSEDHRRVENAIVSDELNALRKKRQNILDQIQPHPLIIDWRGKAKSERRKKARTPWKRFKEILAVVIFCLIVLHSATMIFSAREEVRQNYEDFVCDNGSRIPAELVGNGEKDCFDGSDEEPDGFWAGLGTQRYEKFKRDYDDAISEAGALWFFVALLSGLLLVGLLSWWRIDGIDAEVENEWRNSEEYRMMSEIDSLNSQALVLYNQITPLSAKLSEFDLEWSDENKALLEREIEQFQREIDTFQSEIGRELSKIEKSESDISDSMKNREKVSA